MDHWVLSSVEEDSKSIEGLQIPSYESGAKQSRPTAFQCSGHFVKFLVQDATHAHEALHLQAKTSLPSALTSTSEVAPHRPS